MSVTLIKTKVQIRLQLILKQCLEIKGELVFRPGGGALIENLNNLNADIVLSKI
jgi:hypothetical protein